MSHFALVPNSQIVASVPQADVNASQINHIFDKVGHPDQFFNDDGFEWLIWNEIDECSLAILEDLCKEYSWRLVS